MIRLSKLADYGIVLLSFFVRDPSQVMTARQLSGRSILPLPTVAKVLKALGRAGLLASQRGQAGGYRLARPPELISVVDVIAAVEGPIGMTACTSHLGPRCSLEGACPTRSSWQRINQTVVDALRQLTLCHLSATTGAAPAATPPPRSLVSP